MVLLGARYYDFQIISMKDIAPHDSKLSGKTIQMNKILVTILSR